MLMVLANNITPKPNILVVTNDNWLKYSRKDYSHTLKKVLLLSG